MVVKIVINNSNPSNPNNFLARGRLTGTSELVSVVEVIFHLITRKQLGWPSPPLTAFVAPSEVTKKMKGFVERDSYYISSISVAKRVIEEPLG